MGWKFWDKKKSENGEKKKVAKPKELPQAVGRHLIVKLNLDPDVVWGYRAVMLPHEANKSVFSIRIFSPDQARAKNVLVTDYHSLNQVPEIILYSGTFDKVSGKVDFDVPMAA